MILVRHISNLIDQREEHPTRRVEWREGLRVRDLAPTGFSGVCILNSDRIRFPQFETEVPDNAAVIFVDSEEEPTTLTLIIIAVIAVAALSAAAIAMNRDVGTGLNTRSKQRESTGGVGFDAIDNTTAPGTTIPVPYGESLVGGHVLMAWREGSHGPNRNSQKLFMLISLGEGPIEAIGQYTTEQNELGGGDAPDGMFINGRPIGEYPDVKISTRLGTQNQTPCPGFGEVVKSYDCDPFLLEDETVVWKWKTRNPVNQVDVNFGFLEGLGSSVASTGEEAYLDYDRRVTVKIAVYDEDDDTLITSETFDHNEKSQRKPVYKMESIRDLTPAIYTVRVSVDNYRRESPEDARRKRNCSVLGINERMNCAIAYKWQALVAAEMLATDKLSGRPTLVTTIKGRKVDVGTGTDTYSRNRAWCLRDMAMHWRYGAAAVVKDTTFNEALLEDMADFCDEQVPQSTGSATLEERSRIDAWITEPAKAGRMLQRIAQPARTVIVRNGNTIKTKVRKAGRIPRDGFGVGNVGGRIEITETAADERANIIRGEYRDEADNYKRKIETAALPGITELSGDARPDDIAPLGVVRRSEMAREVAFTLRLQQNVVRAARINDVGIDRLACEPLDIIWITQDNHEGMASGRIAAYDGSSITLDREFAFESGKVYRYRERNNASDEWSSFDFKGDGSTTDTLPFAPLTSGDAVGRLWMICRRDLVEMWEVVKIDPRSDGTATIEAVEYIEENYSTESQLGDTGLFPYTPGDLPDPATDVEAVESFLRHGVSKIDVSWTASADAAEYAIFYRRRDVSPPESWARVGRTAQTSASFECGFLLGTFVTVAVLAISSSGRRDLLDNAPTDTVQIMRDDDYDVLAEFPGTPENFAASMINSVSADVSWDAVANADSYEVREGPWHTGKTIYAGTGTSFQVAFNRMVRPLTIRSKKSHWYSTDEAQLATTAVTPDNQTQGNASFNDRFDTGRILNGQRINYFGGSFFFAVLQSDPNVPVEYVTQIKEIGDLDEYEWHVSLDVRVQTWWEGNIQGFFGTVPHLGMHGFFNKHYLDWEVFLETRWSPGYDPDSQFQEPFEDSAVPNDYRVWDVTSNIVTQTPITITPARWFRIRVRARRATNSRVVNEPFRALITRVAAKFYRSTGV